MGAYTIKLLYKDVCEGKKMKLNSMRFIGLNVLVGFFINGYGLTIGFWQYGVIVLSLWLISFDRVE